MASSLLNSCEQGTVHAVVVSGTSLSGSCIQMLSEYDLEYKDATTLIQKIGAVQFSVLRLAGVVTLLCPLLPQTSPTATALWGLLPRQSFIYPDH